MIGFSGWADEGQESCPCWRRAWAAWAAARPSGPLPAVSA